METTKRIKTILAEFQLPKIDFSSYSVLDDENEDFEAAVKIICNRYQYEKNRRHSLFNAYKELHSAFASVLSQCRQAIDTPSEDQSKIEPVAIQQNSQASSEDIYFNGSDDEQVLTVDLTSVFGFDDSQKPIENLQPTRSKIVKKNLKVNSIESETSKKLLKRNSTGRTEADENRAPLINATSSNNSKSLPETLLNEKSTLKAKVGLSTRYKMGVDKKSTTKTLKQTSLVLDPLPVKIDVGHAEKSNVLCKSGSTLFDESYIDGKTSACLINPGQPSEQSKVDEKIKLPIKTNQQAEIASKIVSSNSKSPSKPNEELIPETSMITDDINDTASSLFDDQSDWDALSESKDLLNTCMESSVAGYELRTTNDDKFVEKKETEAIEEPKCTQMDETFFAPVEAQKTTTTVKNASASISGIGKSREINKDKARPAIKLSLKRKSQNEPVIEAPNDRELKDLAAEVEMCDWNDDWDLNDSRLQPKRNPIDSFHCLPEKIGKIPTFAHKGKVERNKAIRSKLQGWGCADCEKYYGNINMSEQELKKRKDACSRHRSKFDERYNTPMNFWEPHFDDMDSSYDSDDNSASTKIT